jgi:hypothetical protein
MSGDDQDESGMLIAEEEAGEQNEAALEEAAQPEEAAAESGPSQAHRIEKDLMEGPIFRELLGTFNVDQWDGTVMHDRGDQQEPTKKKKKRKKKKKAALPADGDPVAEGDGAAAAAEEARKARADRLQQDGDDTLAPAADTAAVVAAAEAAAAAAAAAPDDPDQPAPAEAAAAATLVATSAAAAAVDSSVAAAAAEPEPSVEEAFLAGDASEALTELSNDLPAEDMSEAVLNGGEWIERSEVVNDEIKVMWETCATATRRQMRTHNDIVDRFHQFAEIVLKVRRYHRQLHDSLVSQLEAAQAAGVPMSCKPATSAMERFRWREHHCELALWHSANALFQGLERACCQLCTAATEAVANLLPVPSATQKRVQYKFLYARSRLDMREPDDTERVNDTLASIDSALDEVAPEDPQKHTMLKFRLKVIFNQMGENAYQWCMSECTRLLDDPDYPQEYKGTAWWIRGNLLGRQGNPRGAMEDYSRFIQDAIHQQNDSPTRRQIRDRESHQNIPVAMQRIGELREVLRDRAETKVEELCTLFSSEKSEPALADMPSSMELTETDAVIPGHCGFAVVGGELKLQPLIGTEELRSSGQIVAGLEDLSAETKEKLVSLVGAGEAHLKTDKYATAVSSLRKHTQNVRTLRDDPSISAVSALVERLDFCEVRAMHHTVEILLEDTKAESKTKKADAKEGKDGKESKKDKSESKNSNNPGGIDLLSRPWVENITPILDFCILFLPFPCQDRERLELAATSRLLASRMYVLAGKLKSARRELDLCIDDSHVQLLPAHQRRLELIILDCPRATDADFKKCNGEFGELLDKMKGNEGMSIANMHRQLFEKMYTRQSDEKSLDHVTAYHTQRKISEMTNEDVLKKVCSSVEKFKHSSNATERLNSMLEDMPMCVRPEACVLLARKVVVGSAVESPRQLSEFALHLCDKAIGYNDECWAAYWYKAAAIKSLQHDRSSDGRWRATPLAGVEALERLANLQPSLESSEEFRSERRRHQYTNEMRRCERLADEDRHQDAMEGLDLTYELVDFAEEFDDVANLRKLRLHLLEQLVKCSHWEGRQDETRWYVERTAQECTELLLLIPKKEKSERAGLLERRARVVLDYDVLPREPKATFTDFSDIIKDINNAVKLSPRDPSLYHLRGWLYQNIEGKRMEKILLINSHNDLNKACSLVRQEKKTSKDKASGVWNSREPTQDLRDTLHLLGKCLFRQKKYREAAAKLDEALKMPWQSLQRKDSEQLKEEIEKIQEKVKAALQEEADKAMAELDSLLGQEDESVAKKANKADKKKKQKAKKAAAAAAAAAAAGTAPKPAVDVDAAAAAPGKKGKNMGSPGRNVTVGDDGSVVEVLQSTTSAGAGAGGGGGGLNKNQKKKQRKKKSKAAAAAVGEAGGSSNGNDNSNGKDKAAAAASSTGDADGQVVASLTKDQAQLQRLLDSNGLAKHSQHLCVDRRMSVEMLKQYGKSDLEGMGLSEQDAGVLMKALWKAPDTVEPAKMLEDYCRMIQMDCTHGGELELAVLAQVLNRTISVYQEEVKQNENQSEDKVNSSTCLLERAKQSCVQQLCRAWFR